MTEIIVLAEKYIHQGKENFRNKVITDPEHFSHIDYYVVYNDVIQLLLKEGYIDRQNPDIQHQYYELIPDPKEYTAEKDNFENLFHHNPVLRIKAAKHFSSQARRVGNIYLKFLFSYPKTFNRLLPALQDNEPKVVSAVIEALECAYHRYFKNENRVTELYKLVYCKR